MPLPVTAIFPIYECADRLCPHLAHAQGWIDAVEEIIVVDSGSKDGSAEIARREIKHPNVKHEVVPPGLYPAWNHAIRIAEAEFCYFSTVGDTIDRTGLEHLVKTAESLAVDVVVSPPRCVEEDRRQTDVRTFPIHSLLESSNVTEAMLLPAWLSYLMATGFSIESFLGSSASNIYRTDCLKESPFPVDFGKAGDAAWFRKNALRFRFALTPRICADFSLHQDHGVRPHGDITILLERLTQLSRNALREYLETSSTAEAREIRILNAWRNIAGASPEKTLDAIRHLEGVAATAEQQRKYIGDLQAEIKKMRAVMVSLEKICQAREMEIARMKSVAPSGSPMSWLRKIKNG
ncbi:MAG: glycosyltransferase family A protein [Verrucomicrobiota bacterium]